MSIEDTLAQRGKTYGNFLIQASIACELKTVMWQHVVWSQHLRPDQREALEMICVKVARILNGDPNYADNWHDIAGYATLVAKRLEDK